MLRESQVARENFGQFGVEFVGRVRWLSVHAHAEGIRIKNTSVRVVRLMTIYSHRNRLLRAEVNEIGSGCNKAAFIATNSSPQEESNRLAP